MSIDKQIESTIKEEPTGADVADLRRMMEESLALNRKIYKLTQKINNHFIWQNVFSIIKILIVVVPLVYGYLYLKPYFGQLMDDYQKIMGLTDQTSLNLDLNALPADILKMIK